MSRSFVLALTLLLSAVTAQARPPRLTLFVVVDGLGSDLLLRSRPQLKGGLKTLLDGGAYFPYARYEYAEPLTAPGHTTLATGTNPARHGIVANRLYNRTTGKLERPFMDAVHPALEAPLGSDDVSPENILVETVADRLREATRGRGKAVAVSEKARASIPLAGHLGQAYWFSDSMGKFVTGTYYAKEFPAWLRTFNDRKLPDGYFGKEWSLLLPSRMYAGDDDRPFEGGIFGLGHTFPHPLTGGLSAPAAPYYGALESTPFMGDILVQLARAALEGESLGKDDVPDLLAVSFSQTDLVQHQYGPYSWETQDALFRLDRQIGELLSAAEKAAGGRSNLLVVLSADHGCDAIPEELAAQGMPAGRINTGTLKAALSKELAARFKGSPDLLLGIEGQSLYLNAKAISDHMLDGALIRKTVATFLRAQANIAAVATREEVMSGAELGGFGPALRLGFHPEHSGDVFIVPRPHFVLADDPLVATHFSPYAYDRLVPVVFYGRSVKKGLYRVPYRVVEVVPAISSILEMSPPASVEGELRPEGMDTNGR